jgi:Domain of unknown function (DUF4123)
VHDDHLADQALLALRHAAGEAPLSIFIDPTLRDPLATDPDADPRAHHASLRDALERSLADGTARRIALPPIHADFDPQRQPYLIHISSEPAAEALVSAALKLALAEAFEADVDEHGERFTGRTICGWILGDADPKARARQLVDAAVLIKPDGQRHYLRYWDPRVLWHLPARLAASHWQALRGALGQWVYFDPLRQWVNTAGEPLQGGALDSRATPASGAEPHQRAPLDPARWQALQRIGPVNQVLAMSWDWGLVPSHARAGQIDRLMLRSIEHGFDSEQDLLVFAACGLTGHPQFDQHPEVAAALQQGAAERTPLQQTLARFDETFWAGLATSAAASSTPSAAPPHSNALAAPAARPGTP